MYTESTLIFVKILKKKIKMEDFCCAEKIVSNLLKNDKFLRLRKTSKVFKKIV